MDIKHMVPTIEHIEAVKVGALAPNAFGNFAEVVEVSARGVDVDGRQYVLYYTRSSATSSMSMTMKAGKLIRHAGLRETSAELDAIARRLGGV